MLHLKAIHTTNAGERMALDARKCRKENKKIYKAVVRTTATHQHNAKTSRKDTTGKSSLRKALQMSMITSFSPRYVCAFFRQKRFVLSIGLVLALIVDTPEYATHNWCGEH